MGCGESKHDAVAAGNTIFRRKQSSKKAAAKKDDDRTVHQKDPTAEKASGGESIAAVDSARDPHVADQISGTDHDHNPNEHRATDVANRHENDVASTVVEARDVKNDDNVNVVEDNGGKVVDDHKISEDNQDQDREELVGIDGIISDGRSGKSEYNTPPRGSSAGSVNRTVEDLKPDDHDHDDQINNGGAENDVKIGDQSKADQEDQTVAEKSENVENLEKEELEVSVPAEEENSTTTPNAEEKHVVG